MLAISFLLFMILRGCCRGWVIALAVAFIMRMMESAITYHPPQVSLDIPRALDTAAVQAPYPSSAHEVIVTFPYMAQPVNTACFKRGFGEM
ncbi:hypothetical protein B0T18DRAFT_153023 [Schizothecium vesticola]|uniref:Uncharacterized protein n=1 Tax=Schizothecium vesticola TaxID=314040 RepID=A0AA40K5A5_9PEZI|nr:hypothetical protein B0T18DRAFT_153023 [Schizothecium vesticola]